MDPQYIRDFWCVVCCSTIMVNLSMSSSRLTFMCTHIIRSDSRSMYVIVWITSVVPSRLVSWQTLLLNFCILDDISPCLLSYPSCADCLLLSANLLVLSRRSLCVFALLVLLCGFFLWLSIMTSCEAVSYCSGYVVFKYYRFVVVRIGLVWNVCEG